MARLEPWDVVFRHGLAKGQFSYLIVLIQKIFIYLWMSPFPHAKEFFTADVFSKNHVYVKRFYPARPPAHSGLPQDSNELLLLESDASIHRDILCQRQNRVCPSI